MIIQHEQNDTPPVLEEKEAANPEKEGSSPVSNQPHTELSGRFLLPGVFSIIGLRVQYVPPGPALTLAELRQKVRGAYRREEEQRLGGGTDRPFSSNPTRSNRTADQMLDDMAKTYQYRRPLFPQLRDHKKHPILARLFWAYLSFAFRFDPPWNHIQITLIRRKVETKGGAA